MPKDKPQDDAEKELRKGIEKANEIQRGGTVFPDRDKPKKDKKK